MQPAWALARFIIAMHCNGPSIDPVSRTPERAALGALAIAMHLTDLALRVALPDLQHRAGEVDGHSRGQRAQVSSVHDLQ